MHSRVLLMVLFSSASTAIAEERFYQVMDASGRMQVIREPTSPSSEKVEAVTASSPKLVDQNLVPVRSELQTQPSAKAKSVLAPYASYDGDEYVDSEAMDNSHQTQREKQRFFIMSDGAGQRIENMSGGYEQASASPSQSSVLQDEFLSLRVSYTQLPLTLARVMPNGCLSGQQIEGARALGSSRLSDVVFDKQLMNFVAPGQAIQVYRVSSEGARTISFRSYSRTDVEPAFAVPFVAFADGKGCINRIVDGYFQRFYPETKSRHPLLEGELVMHADDAYVMLIMPMSEVGGRNYKPEYRISSLGRISIKWQQ